MEEAMYTHSRRLLLTASAVIAVFALPVTARAQMEPIRVTEALQKAEKLDAEALSYEQNDWAQLKKAARLRELAAELRTPEDPAGTVSLYWAARDRYYSGDPKAARVLMEQAADRALAMGDVLNAVTAYTEAAYICADIKDGDRMRTLAAKAKLLANSPMLSAEQRLQLRTRLAKNDAPVGVVASLDKPSR
jgi:hypothetical protein